MPTLEQGKEVIPALLPFYHIYGQVVVMLNGLTMGATLVLFTTPDLDEVLDSMERYRATTFFSVPTAYQFLKDYDKTGRFNWKNLKIITSGADTLHESTVKDWERRTGSKIQEGYGLTECAAVSHLNPMGRSKIGSFGVPLPNIIAAVVNYETNEFLPPGEIGEMILHGPNIMKGYWKRPKDTEESLIDIDGKIWLKTGDLVRMDDEGYFFFYDRKKDMIKYKGYSVFAREIEEVLHQHPKVKAAGVLGVPDPTVGQLIKAIVVLQPEARGRVSEEEIIKYCAENLAHYKVPKIVEFRGELPKTDVGKVSHRELREELDEA
jgi:long-chain acyl-CoA synthetase